MDTPVIRVAIVEDLADIRHGLISLIDGANGVVCVGEFEDGVDALDGIPRIDPHVVLMDIDMPRMNGIECVRALTRTMPSLGIIMLTVFDDDEKIFQSLVAGARGYILKKSPSDKLLEAIRDMHAGGSPMSSQIARKVVNAFRQMGPSVMESENLSSREQEILEYLAKGFLYKEIAGALFISTDTVRTHLHNIYRKLQVRSRTEAVVKYFGR